jgi:hypothetical protein
LIPLPLIEDIGHTIAAACKSQFEKTSEYKHFTSLISSTAKQLRQTKYAALTPPKLRSKGRFQSIHRVAKWSQKMLKRLAHPVSEDPNLQIKLDKLHPEFEQAMPFIEKLAKTSQVTSAIMKCLKNKGLNSDTAEHCQQLNKQLPKSSKVRQRIEQWLIHHQQIQQQLTPYPISSDIIESLFGHFKHLLSRTSQADMNRSTLLIPTLCGHINTQNIAQAHSEASHDDLAQWEKDNVGYTVRKQRYSIFQQIQEL